MNVFDYQDNLGANSCFVFVLHQLARTRTPTFIVFLSYFVLSTSIQY